jgi:uncharacterized protein (DUF1697 family)
MKTWIALLRGINVGGNNILPMKELVTLMEENGFINVKTYIQSGNVVFQHAHSPKDEISTLIENNYGFRPRVFVLSAEDLQDAIQQNPFPTDIGKAVHFNFCDKKPTFVDFELLDGLKSQSEDYKLVDKVFYVFAPEGIGRSKMVAKMMKAFKGISMTGRNFNTITKLASMIESYKSDSYLGI